jgi:hypothetical protein
VSNVTRIRPPPKCPGLACNGCEDPRCVWYAAQIAPQFRPHFSREGLDSLIDLLVKKTVATIRAREAAQRRNTAQSD